jgi:2-C-methyl-D-erythritol 2,4-cyclodiphosphate synthase
VNLDTINRLTDKGRTALHWAFLAALREEKNEIGSTHLLMGIQCANPQILAGVNFSSPGILPLDVSDIGQIQQEMQKRYMQASLAHTKEERSGVPGFAVPFALSSKEIMEIAAECSKSFGARTIGTPHLLYATLKADPQLAGKLVQANLDEARVLSFCRDYKDGEEGESTAQMIQNMQSRAFRSGIGYDLHRLAEGRKLIVGGIELAFEKGPVGHSDGDVLAHAMCDALLGAAGAGDIGTHFPDTDPKWKGANSLLFLQHTRKLIDEKGFDIEFVDAVVIMEKPKLGPHFPKMREALAKALGVDAEKIHLKAKTNEGVDAIGRGEAIAAHVVATLVSR